ncbi:hypothetical protein TNCV_3826271 [Trichonephila clavipes]|nr:hypothetical protein TNCV_3826271 [Trichonephila clavipes]
MRCAAFPFETGIHFRRKTDFSPEEDTTKPYSGFEPEPTRATKQAPNANSCAADSFHHSPKFLSKQSSSEGQHGCPFKLQIVH